MTMFFNQQKNVDLLPRDFSPGPDTDFVENTAAAWNATRHNDLAASRSVNQYDAIQGYIDEIYEATGRRFKHPSNEAISFNVLGTKAGEKIEADFFAATAASAAETNLFTAKSREEIEKDIAARGVMLEAEFEKVSSRATGPGVLGTFVGAIGAAFTDPPLLFSLPLGAPAASGILRTGIIEGLIGATTEALVQPTVQGYRAELGLDAGFDRALINIGFGAVGGAGFGAGLKSLGVLAGWSSKKLIKAFDDVVVEPTPEQRGARDAMQEVANQEQSNPYKDVPTARQDHDRRTVEAVNAAIDMKVPEMPERAVSAQEPVSKLVNGDGGIKRISPNDIIVDAKRFQFKSETDQFGVSARLKDVEKWDEIKAGVVVLWRDNGKLFVADGHQRVGLAKRLKDPDIKINAFVLSAADGVTDIDARVIAAAKNIAEGTGSAVEAAKVLRAAPGFELNLPPTSVLVRQAQNLARVSDDAFGMVVNELVPENYAALVGKLVDDEDLHLAIMEILAEAQPANVVQAEAIVRQAQVAGKSKEVQQTLFGDEEITTSLFKDRARILDKALKKLRSDKRVFKTLVDEESRITGAGNRLDRSENLRQETINGRAEHLIQRLAHSHGQISEALNAAARKAKADGRDAGAVDEFISAVRAGSGRADFLRGELGQPGRAGEAAGEIGQASALIPDETVEFANLKDFDEPDGVGATAQEQTAMNEFDAGTDTDQILLGFDVNEAGETKARLGSRGDLKQEFADDVAFEQTIEGCAS